MFCVEGTETGLSYGVEADGLEYTRTQDHLGEQAFFAFFVILGILLTFPARVHDTDDHFKFDLGLCHDDQTFFIRKQLFDLVEAAGQLGEVVVFPNFSNCGETFLAWLLELGKSTTLRNLVSRRR